MTAPRANVTRFRLFAGCALLTGLAFIQDPGLLAADTKFDLVEAPARFLARSLHLWDAHGALGQLQNQAYGYLWPMGPFFLLGHVVDLPGWVVQRLWLALVLCVAFLGTAKLARTLGVRSDLACIVAGTAYALSPRMLTTLGPISIEAWPSALAPWVLLPLVVGATRGSPRRAAALSALAVASVGGVNAAATFAVLPMGVVWLLTRTPGPRRRIMITWWPVFTLVGTLWWLVPLFLMGAYSPPFLDYIETTSVTTFPTDLFDAFRGTSNWVPYVSSQSRAGNDLIVLGFLALSSGILLFAGFAGLMSRRNPHRLFLGLSLLVGVLMVTAGHTGSVHGWLSGDIRSLLDGPMAPLRNVHKFDPIIRLPLVLGVAFVLGRWRDVSEARSSGIQDVGTEAVQRWTITEEVLARANRASVMGMVLVAVIAAASPALIGRIVPAYPVLEVPTYWHEASDWLDQHAEAGSSLLVPGSAFASYVWGSPRDEPLQYLGDAPWAVRNQIPLTPPGNIRMLSEVEDRFAQGRGSAGLTDYLRRAGLHYLVVRNDLQRGNDVPDPVLVHEALADSPGLRRVRQFGPAVGGGAHLTVDGVRTVINGGWQTLYPAVEVFEIAGTTPQGEATSAPVVAAAGPEDLLDLADLNVIDDGAVMLGSDVPGNKISGPVAGGPLVLTDGLRSRENYYPRLHDNRSAVLVPGQARRSGNPTRDYLAPGQDAWSTRAELEGARSLSASSSGSDANNPGGTRRGEQPYAAVDGSADSEWRTSSGQEGDSWWRLDLDTARKVSSVRLTGGPSAAVRQSVRVVTATGASGPVDLGPGESSVVPLSGARTAWLRVEAAPGSTEQPLALAEVEIPGVRVVRRLSLPTLPSSWGDPDVVVLRPDLDTRRGCVVIDGDVRCSPKEQRASEEPVQAARGLRLASDHDYVPELRVRARSSDALTSVLLADQPVAIEASSTAVADQRGSAVAAIDNDPGTTWTADPKDLRPTLTLRWLLARPVTGISITGSDDTAARVPTKVTLVWPTGRRTVELDQRGEARFPAIRTDQIQVRVDSAENVKSLDFNSQASEVGVGVGELRLRGVPFLPLILPTTTVNRACGSGPEVLVNGRRYLTTVTASPAELFAGTEVPAVICGSTASADSTEVSPLRPDAPIELRAGENQLTLTHAPAFDLVSAVFRQPAAPRPGPVTPAGSEATGSTRLRLDVPTDGVLVGLAQNYNVGWHAEQGGRALTSVVLDGWRQGWIVPGGAAEGGAPIVARFAPDPIYRVGLLGGLLALLLLLTTVFVRRRSRADCHAPLTVRRLGVPASLGLVLVGAIAVAGLTGALLAALASMLVALIRHRAPEAAPWLLATPCLVVSMAFFIRPWGDPSGWAGSAAWTSYLMLIPLAGVLLSAGAARPRFFRRMAGPSTKR